MQINLSVPSVSPVWQAVTGVGDLAGLPVSVAVSPWKLVTVSASGLCVRLAWAGGCLTHSFCKLAIITTSFRGVLHRCACPPCQAGSGLLAADVVNSRASVAVDAEQLSRPAQSFNYRVKLQEVLPGLVSTLTNTAFLFSSVEFLG